MKFNHAQLLEDDFRNLIKTHWLHVYHQGGVSATKKFSYNLHIIRVIKGQENFLALNSRKELIEVEEGIKELFDHNDSGVYFKEDEKSLKEMEMKRELLDNEETCWRLKSRAIWEEGCYHSIILSVKVYGRIVPFIKRSLIWKFSCKKTLSVLSGGFI